MKGFLYFLLIFIITGFCLDAHAQRDTEFWFAAPDNTSATTNQRDYPILLRISTFDTESIVRLSQPANPSFGIIELSIGASSTKTIVLAELREDLDGIECRPAGEIVPYGFHLTATNPVTAYLENNSAANPDIYTLKGRNGMGYNFVIPSQNTYDNTSAWQAIPNTFLVVASQDNTEIEVSPNKNIEGGYTAGNTYSFILNKGEVFVAQSTSQAADQHLNGSIVSANKEVSVMVNDDSVRPIGPDLMGDQTIPNEMAGQVHIVVKGEYSGSENVYIHGIEDNTKIYFDGNSIPATSLNQGELYVYSLNSTSTLIESDQPIIVYHMSGWQQPGGAVIPPIECTGSNTISFTRSTSDGFFLMLFTKTEHINNFLVNESSTIITAGDFSEVPGTNGTWQAAKKQLNSGIIPVGAASIVKNTSGLFHLGIINGNNNSCRYGFFSNFASLNLGPDQTYCKGDSVVLDAGPGQDSYAWFDYDFQLDTISTEQAIKVGDTGKYFCCATYEMCTPSDTIHLAWYPVPQPDLGNDTTVCPNIPVLFYPGDFAAYNWFDGSTDTAYESFLPQTIWVEVFDANGCHKIDSVEMFNFPKPPPIPVYHD